MFDFLKKDSGPEKALVAPVTGSCIAITEVADAAFSSKALGDGVAFEYEGDTVYAPCAGEIMLVAGTKHAVGIRSNGGLELLIHVGMDTVDLEGEGFEVFVKTGQKIKAGAPLIKVDRAFMKSKGICLTTPMTVTNWEEFQLEMSGAGQSVVQGETEVVKIG